MKCGEVLLPALVCVQVWATSAATGQVAAPADLPDGVKLLSLDEGRSYEVGVHFSYKYFLMQKYF